MHDRAYRIVLAALTLVALASLLALRFVGSYSHQVLALFLLLGVIWAILGPGGIAWKGRLRIEVRRALGLNWDQPLLSPADGRVVFVRDDMDDAEGVGTVSTVADAAGNVIVIELDSGQFVVLAHLRQGSLQVEEGDFVQAGDVLARVGNSGNTTMPHLHLQVQTHADMWDPDNRSVPFSFDTDGRVPVRNDRVRAE